ncbi:MAG: helix-turn-helix transcriptional regulator [Myxococcales bacterium]|nr:helix-turn-helix transcriptional regulator [Myxococcales bacterium]
MPGRIHPAVVTVVLGGLRRVAPERLPDDSVLDALLAHEDGVPLEPYRAVIDEVLRAGGGAALVEAGATVEELEHPFLFVLINASSPTEVLAKMERLGRFIHSRHHQVVVASSERHLVLDHRSSVGEPPHPSEDLAACGQHLALFAEIGCQGLRARFPRTSDAWVYEGGRCAPLAPDADYSRWEIAWDALVPTRRPMPGLDALLLANVDERALREAPRVVTRLEEVLRGDLARSWRLEDVADALELAPRSLQRALSRAGTSFTRVLDRVRVEEAARLLEGSDLSITEIGFVCGFSDGAHFGRRFLAHRGARPSAYRAARRT